jgi:PAS domain S-box-containing protein
MPRPRFLPWAAQLVLAGVGLILVTFVCFQLDADISSAGFAYVLLVALLSLLGSFSVSIIVSTVAIGCLNYFFVPPLFAFRVDAPQDILALAAFATTSLVITVLTAKVRRSTEAAQASQQALIDTVPALVWTALPDGSRDFHSRRWLEFTGISAAEAAGNGWAAAHHPEDRANILAKWRSAVATGELFEVEARVRNTTGEYRAILIRAAPLRDETGAIAKWCGVSTDIEDRRRAAEALRASEEQLQQALAELAWISRVTMVGEMTAAIAHEVKQPMAAAVTNAEAALQWLDSREPDLEEVRAALARIVKDGHRAGEVIDRVRALVKKTPSRRDLWEVNGAIREMLELTRGEVAKNHILVQTELADDLPPVEGDRVQLQQVMLNLVVNAVEAMSGVTDVPCKLLICSRRGEGGDVLVAVSDSGPGLAPSQHEQVFDAFYTTKATGLGLGLSICRSIIEAHGGRLWASANVPRGAIFQFTLPAGRSVGS